MLTKSELAEFIDRAQQQLYRLHYLNTCTPKNAEFDNAVAVVLQHELGYLAEWATHTLGQLRGGGSAHEH